MIAATEPEAEPSLNLFDGATDLMCVRDMQGRFVRVNHAWETTLGLSTDEVLNTPLLPLVHPADVPATLLRMAEADRCGQVVDFVNRYRRRDGHYRHLQWRAGRVGDVILGRARDVTVHRLREDEVRIAQRALEETLADVGDRLRAPADAILTTVQALGHTALTPVQRAMVQALGRSVETLEELVAQLMEREAAWASSLPTVERLRPAAAPRIATVSTHIGPALTGEQADLVRGPDIKPSSVLQRWVLETSRHVDQNPVFHRNFRDLPSRTLGLLVIRLDHLGGFYPRRLQGLSCQSGLMSAGRAASLLARMQDIGFVDVAGRFQAGRIRPYRVQAAMRKSFAELLAIDLRSMAASDYRAVLALEAMEKDGTRTTPLLAAFAAALLDDLTAGEDALGIRLNGVPSMARGQAVALSIAVDAIGRRGGAGEGWIDISLTDYASRFDVSRMHVGRIVESLEACGLLRDPVSPSRLRVTGRFLEELDSYRQAECDVLARALGRLV
ncbi:PAS domain-containing protein [Sphingomonas sp. KR1UV-12]|uniref:PAS domain-containing protein n=1 Tax=Sphingomonas aurea TaxID=3063994 RepID=A0ABT9EIR0_9SPHN|nr:PAS domain-containing protein [Sphingomonas sp. KR1UV-12]MDP1026853.1 PAS domain-containing protein [Sphingomonas sp. KR1UV-12]